VPAAIGLTFAGPLRSFLRQDPDVILVGEVRDQETAETCLRAALTGHLVLSTLHTNSAIEAVVRLTDMGVEAFMLASSVRMLAAQRLVRTLCPTCKIAYRPDKDELNSCLNQCMLNPKPDASQLVFYKAKGCPNCHNTGYNGRKAVYEIYYITGKLRTAIYKHADDIEAMKKIAEEEGMWDMRASAWRKVMEGITSVEEVEAVTVSD
jgi:type IV pilus assembly protein PilB